MYLDKSSTDIGVYDVSEEFYKRGEAKFNRAISLYRDFFVRDQDLDSYTISRNIVKKHTKIYMKYFNYVLDDFIPCEVCGEQSSRYSSYRE